MRTTNESGHVNNVENLELFINCCITFGIIYNPSRASLKVAGLTLSKQQARAAIDLVNSTEVNCQSAISARITDFILFDPFITRVINALESSGVSPQTLRQAKAMVRELRGIRAVDKPATPEGSSENEVVLHNRTFDRKTENLIKFILFLASIPEYKPNEADLTIVFLNARAIEIKALTTECNTCASLISAARIARDITLYTPVTGMVDNALSAKLYVKSVFGATSPQYKMISNISFANHR